MTTATDFVTDAFKQLSDSFARTIEMGTKFHEETARFWIDAANKGAETARSQWQKAADEAVPFARKNAERFQKLFQEQAERSLDLLRKNTDAAAKKATPNEMFDRVSELWRTSFDTMRESVDALAKANADMFQTWTEQGCKAAGVSAGNGEEARKRPAKQ